MQDSTFSFPPPTLPPFPPTGANLPSGVALWWSWGWARRPERGQQAGGRPGGLREARRTEGGQEAGGRPGSLAIDQQNPNHSIILLLSFIYVKQISHVLLMIFKSSVKP